MRYGITKRIYVLVVLLATQSKLMLCKGNDVQIWKTRNVDVIVNLRMYTSLAYYRYVLILVVGFSTALPLTF